MPRRVVALSDVEHPHAAYGAEGGLDGGEVGDRLGGVFALAHRVDDGHPRLGREGGDLGVRAGRTGHQDVDHAGQHAGGVLVVSPVLSCRSPGPYEMICAPRRSAAAENAVRVR